MRQLKGRSFLLTVTGLLIAGCSVRTYYVKNSYRDSIDRQVRSVSWIMPAHQEDVGYSFVCINTGKLQWLIDTDQEFEEIKNDPDLSHNGRLISSAATVVRDAHVDCAEVISAPQNAPACAAQPVSFSPPATLAQLTNPTTNQLYAWLEGSTKDTVKPWQACLKAISGGVSGDDLCDPPPPSTQIPYQPFNEPTSISRGTWRNR
jgi:hypothetical protein